MAYPLASILSRFTNTADFFIHSKPVSYQDERLRVLYIIGKYPEYSETYMHEEMTRVSKEFDTRITSYLHAVNPRANHLPYELIEYKDACINWGDFTLVNTTFTNKLQVQYLEEMAAVIRKFRPHVLHGHYFATSLIIRKLSDIHGIPFTLRTHSFDMLQQDTGKIDALCNAVNSPLCVGIFTYPEFRNTLLQHGINEGKIFISWPVVNVKRFLNTGKPVRTGQILCCGPCTYKKAHDQFIEFANSMRNSGLVFNLYTRGNCENRIRKYNASIGSPVNILYSEPEHMPEVYRHHDWLLYPSDTNIREVGLPCSIIEAQASGIGVCWQEIPGRRQAQLDFLGGAGFLFKTYDEARKIITGEYPGEMRQLGYENCLKCDVELHGKKLASAWNTFRENQGLQDNVSVP